jgi:hypothetical protein
MRAVLIDPFAKTIEEVDYSGELDDVYRLTWTDIVETVQVDREHHMYVDEEGMMQKDQRFFRVAGYPQPLAGRGLIVRSDREGNDVPARPGMVSAMKAIVSWVRPDLRIEAIETIEDEVDHPILGRVPRIRTVPVFTTKKEEK